MSLGPLMLDLLGNTLLEKERALLRNPQVGGVILFTRNFVAPEQIAALTAEIRRLRKPELLIAVDHEGGRVQRFREGFVRLPPARSFGMLHDQDPEQGCRSARLSGWLMAAELRAVGVDFSFAPVADLDHGCSEVIGDRAFHSTPEVAALLTRHYLLGMREAGMAGVAKHFPGHGAALADSHLARAVDERSWAEIEAQDLVPFKVLVEAGVAGVMPAHVVYPAIDPQPAGYSRYWLQQVLRERLGFNGAVLSDDLSMLGAADCGGFDARARAALEAGCDMILVCNQPEGAERALHALESFENAHSQKRLDGLRALPVPALDWQALHNSPRWHEAAAAACT